MDIGNQKVKNNFYAGFEGEPEVIIQSISNPDHTLHIWEGYIDDILSVPNYTSEDWKGFTRDYQECSGPWGNEREEVIKNISEYSNDLLSYKNRTFDFPVSAEVIEAIIELLESEDASDGIKIKIS